MLNQLEAVFVCVIGDKQMASSLIKEPFTLRAAGA